MNMTSTTSPQHWGKPEREPDISGNRPGRTEHDLERWRLLTQQVADLADHNNWTKAEVARRISIPNGTFSQWFSGKYEGRLDNTNKQIAIWIEAMEAAGGISSKLVSAPGFVATRTADEFMNTLMLAHQAAKMVIITAEAGMGKTMSFRRYMATRPHVHLITISPHTKTVHGMLTEIAAALDLKQHNPAKLVRSIGEWLNRTEAPTLLIIDEAQNLKDDAIDQLRHFSDVYGCGIALGGNTEIYGRFSVRADGPSYAQIKRRVAKRIKRTRPYQEDINAILNAWGVKDDDQIRFLNGIGIKHGALGSITETMTLAHLLAAGDDKPLSLQHLKAAWKERDMEGF